MRSLLLRLTIAALPLLAGCAHQIEAPEPVAGIEIPADWSQIGRAHV